MNDIGVCIVVSKNDGINQTKFFLEDILRKSKTTPINLYILSNACEDSLRDYLKSICDSFYSEIENPKKSENFIHVEEEIPYFEAYNKLFVLVKESYIFSISNGVFINDYWYIELLNSAHLIKNSGIISINSFQYKNNFTSALVEDEMKIIYKPLESNELIRGPYFMSTNIVRIIGGYEPELFNTGYELDEICWRFRKNNLNNYYVSGINCIDTLLFCRMKEKTEEGKEIYDRVIKEKTKNRIYKSRF